MQRRGIQSSGHAPGSKPKIVIMPAQHSSSSYAASSSTRHDDTSRHAERQNRFNPGVQTATSHRQMPSSSSNEPSWQQAQGAWNQGWGQSSWWQSNAPWQQRYGNTDDSSWSSYYGPTRSPDRRNHSRSDRDNQIPRRDPQRSRNIDIRERTTTNNTECKESI